MMPAFVSRGDGHFLHVSDWGDGPPCSSWLDGLWTAEFGVKLGFVSMTQVSGPSLTTETDTVVLPIGRPTLTTTWPTISLR